MFKLNEILDYCLSKKGAYVDFPFGDIPICVKYNGHIFAEIYPKDNRVLLKLQFQKNFHSKTAFASSQRFARFGTKREQMQRLILKLTKFQNKSNDYKITLRCIPEIGQMYREKYPEIIIPGYHVPLKQRKYKNTVKLDNNIIGKEIYKLIDQSYETLIKGY